MSIVVEESHSLVWVWDSFRFMPEIWIRKKCQLRRHWHPDIDEKSFILVV